MSSYNSTTYCQSTSPQRAASRNPAASPLRQCAIVLSFASRSRTPRLKVDNACAALKHLLTVKMLPIPARDGRGMVQPFMKELPLTLVCTLFFGFLFTAGFPDAVHAQLIRENSA